MDEHEEEIRLMKEELEEAHRREREADAVLKVTSKRKASHELASGTTAVAAVVVVVVVFFYFFFSTNDAWT